MVHSTLALILAASTSWGPPLPARRIAVVARSPDVAATAVTIAAHRTAVGDEVVSTVDIEAQLRTRLEADPAWQDALGQHARGLDAEQNLDLDAAVTAFEASRAAMEKVGAPALERSTYGELLEQLARVYFEEGSAEKALEVLKAWARVSAAELDARSFPPPFIALSRQARAEVPAVNPSVSLDAFWASGLVDWVVEVDAAGPSGGASATLLLYYRPSSPRPVAVAPVVVSGLTHDQAIHELELACDGLFSGPGPAAPLAAPIPAAPVRNPNDVSTPISLFTGMAWPYWDNYSRYGVSSTGIGLDLGARFGFHGAELGGMIEVMGGSFSRYQFAPVIRWTWTKGRFAFFVEPGVYLEIRQGLTGEASPAFTEVTPSQTDVLLGVQGSAGIGLHLSEQWVLAEQVAVGAILAGDFDLNAPMGFHTTLSYTF